MVDDIFISFADEKQSLMLKAEVALAAIANLRSKVYLDVAESDVIDWTLQF